MSVQSNFTGVGVGGTTYFFTVSKSLVEEVDHTTSKLQEHFYDIFEYLKHFEIALKSNRGKAVSALQKRIGEHFDFISKSAPAILLFMDTTQAALHTLNSTDQGTGTIHTSQERQQLIYDFSIENTEDIQLSYLSLKAEAQKLQNVFMTIEEVLNDFISLFDSIINTTKVPWGKYTSLWNEGKIVCQTLTEEMHIQVEGLMNDTDTLINEMQRIDHYLAFGSRA